MKKVISFSLYGTDRKYLEGMLCNAELSPLIYPGWECRIYYGHNIDINYIERLKKYDHVELVIKQETDHQHCGMFWRFEAIDDEDVSVMLSRDADSRLSYREKKCTDLFLMSDNILHSIRDNANHGDMMGGTWGIKKNNRINNVKELIKDWEHLNYYGIDQDFIRKIIEPQFKDSSLIHCSTYLHTFPESEKTHHFVGEVFPASNYNKPYHHIFY